MAAKTWISRFDELHEAAAAPTSLSDFGDTAYHEGLRVLLEALDRDPPVSLARTGAAEGQIAGALAARLHTQAQWQAHPGYKAREIPRPLIVIGVPRTGTTALHNLLSQDPQFQGIEKWLCAAPLVRPPREEWEAHPQYQASAAATEQMFAIAPEVMKAHGVLPDQVDECLLPMAQSFCCNWFPSQLDVPYYDEWFAQADETGSFRRYKDILRLVGMNDDRPWLLKNPSHVFGVDAMLAVFPDACVVQTHRNPVSSLASLVNLLGNIMVAYTGEDIDRPRRLARETAFWSEALRRTMAAQDRQPDRFVNVFQPDIRRDPLGVVRSIYDKFGFTLTEEAEQRMLAWAARNDEQAGDGHSYEKIADEGPIREAFAGYMARYGF
ncbi:MAG: sulfotransferase [Novosphingobium sp.]|nr:sulfotransferase [Novosphingobium sp.]